VEKERMGGTRGGKGKRKVVVEILSSDAESKGESEESGDEVSVGK